MMIKNNRPSEYSKQGSFKSGMARDGYKTSVIQGLSKQLSSNAQTPISGYKTPSRPAPRSNILVQRATAEINKHSSGVKYSHVGKIPMS